MCPVKCGMKLFPLHWRHNECDGISNHQCFECLLNRLFRRRSKKTSELRVTGLCEGNSPVTGEIPYQRSVTQKMFPFDDIIMSIPKLQEHCWSLGMDKKFHLTLWWKWSLIQVEVKSNHVNKGGPRTLPKKPMWDSKDIYSWQTWYAYTAVEMCHCYAPYDLMSTGFYYFTGYKGEALLS